MLSVMIAGAIALAAPQQQQQIDTTFAVRPAGRLDVDSYAGTVTVRSWARNEVRVQATHTSAAEVDIGYRGSTVTVESSLNGPPTERSAVAFTITIPRSFSVGVEGVNVGVGVEAINGNVTIETVNGGISVKDITGSVDVESVSGQVTVDGVRGKVTAAGTNNGVRVSNVTGDIDAETVNGSIIISNAVATSVHAETVNGSISLGTTLRDGGRYSAATTNGNISMAVPEGANATIDVSTFSGRLEARPPLTAERHRGGSYTVRSGNGSARVDLETFSGTVQLTRSGSK